MPRPDNAVEIAFQQRHSCAFHRDIGTGPHGNPNIRSRQGWSVVDTIACHRNGPALSPESLDDLALVLWQHLRLNLGDAELGGNGLCRRIVVSGQHDHANASCLQRGNGGWRGRLDWVGDRDDAGHLAVDRYEDRCGAFFTHLIGRRRQTRGIDAALRHDPLIADDKVTPFNRANNALANWRVEALRLSE